MGKKLAYTLMCVASAIMVLAGVPNVKVGEFQSMGVGQVLHADIYDRDASPTFQDFWHA